MTDSEEKLPEEPQGFLNIAHRGASAYAPENTAAAFEKAISCRADMIEFDLRQTSDGVVVIFHNPAVTTPTGELRRVSKTSLADLSEITSKNGFPVLTFRDALRDFGGRIAMDIEIKVGGFEKDVVKLLRENPPPFEPVISSFKPEILRRIKKLDGNLKVGLIIGASKIKSLSFIARPFVERILARSIYDTVHLHKSLISQSIMESLLDAGFPVFAWTVNDPQEIMALVQQGVGGIISDFPDVVYNACAGMADSQNPVLSRSAGREYHFGFAFARSGMR